MIEKLKSLGLNEYEAKSYLALLKYGAQMGRKVAKKSEVPPTRVFDILKSLREKGLVNLIQEKPMIWAAVKPNIGLKSFVESKVNDMKELEMAVLKSVKELKPTSQIPRIHEKVIVVSGYKKMYDLFIEYLKSTKKECVVYSVGEEIPYRVKTEGRRAVKRGIDLRLVATKYDEENKHILKERIKEGWKLKYYPGSGEYTFAVLDKKTALINVRNPKIKEERISIFFENPELSKALIEYYNIIWKKSKPINF